MDGWPSAYIKESYIGSEPLGVVTAEGRRTYALKIPYDFYFPDFGELRLPAQHRQPFSGLCRARIVGSVDASAENSLGKNLKVPLLNKRRKEVNHDEVEG